jgi:hypothetical protein
MAIEKVIDINIKGNADEAVGSLKSQLRLAQAEVSTLADKFGATSIQAVEAAKQAAILKDKIGDAKALTEAFNPDAKFKAVSASLSGVASGFAAYQGAMGLAGVESKDLEKQLLKVQSAMAIAQGLQGLGEARDSFKQLKAVGVNAFNAIKSAIGATGIGLIVVAAGAIYAYWDDIKGAVSGVSEEQKKLNKISQINADQSAEKLKNLGNQDNILKLQGKSEREILKIKMKATDEAIAAAKINIKTQEISNAAAIEGAKRNYQYLKSAIDFVTIPQRYLYENAAKAINSIIGLINKIPGVEIEARLDEKFGDKATDYLAKLAFDPAQTKADGEATIKSAKESIDKMVNDRAGMQLSINAIDNTASKKLTDEKAAADKKAAEDKLSADMDSAKKAIEILDELNKKTETPAQKETREYEEKLAILRANNLSTEKLTKDHLDELKKIEDDIRLKADEKKAADLEKIVNDQTATYDARVEAIDAEQALYQKQLDDKVITEEQFNDKTKALSAARVNIDKAEAEAKRALFAKTSETLNKGADLLGKNTAAGKAMAAAAALINTYQGITAELATKTVTPFEIGLKIANVAIIAATGFKAVQDIVSVQIPGGGGGGGGAQTGSAPSMTAPSFNTVGSSSTNQLAQTIGSQSQTPIKSYVVASDVSTAQALDRNIISNASI